MMPQDFTEQLLNAAMASNDGVLSPMAMQAAERLKSREEGIADLRAQLAAAEDDKLAAMGRVMEAAISVATGISNGYDQLAENHPNEDARARLHARSRAISHVIIHIRALKLDALAEGEK